jgi:hypothetical protein
MSKKYKNKAQPSLFDLFAPPKKIVQQGQVDEDDDLVKLYKAKKDYRVVVFFTNGQRMGSWFTDTPSHAQHIVDTDTLHDDALIMTHDDYYETYGGYKWLRPETVIKSSI